MAFGDTGKRIPEEVAGEAAQEKQDIFVGENKKRRRSGSEVGSEPRSVLETMRSLSPPTSPSTLSSSPCGGGGGGGSSDAASVPVSVAPAADSGPLAEEEGSGDWTQRREEWAAELQPIIAGLDFGFASGESGTLGMEDWEAVLSEPAALAGQDQTFSHWIMGDVDHTTNTSPAAGDGPIKQPLLSPGPAEFDGHNAGLGCGGLADPDFGLETIGGIDAAPSVCTSTITLPLPSPSLSYSPLASGGVGLSLSSSNSKGIPPPPPNTGIQGPTFGSQSSHPLFSPPRPTNVIPPAQAGMFFEETIGDGPQLFCSSSLLNQQLQNRAPSNPALFVPVPSFATVPAAHQPLSPSQRRPPQDLTRSPFPSPFSRPGLLPQRIQLAQQSSLSSQPIAYHHLHRLVRPRSASGVASAAPQKEQALVDQLFRAAKMVEDEDLVGARGILARLNHQLPSPRDKPLLRAAFYFKEALHRIVGDASNSINSPPPAHARRPFQTPITRALESVLKLTSLKSFSDVSPILMFTNFTSIQVLLEGFDVADCIHIVDFDIGSGTHWSAFMQELAQRSCTAGGPPTLRITVFVSLDTYGPLDLELACGTLAFWAGRLNIPFEFSVMNIHDFDPLAIRSMVDAPIAVHLPVGSAHNLSLSLLHLVKQLAPKVVISVDLGRDRSELPFSHHFHHAFQSCMVLLDSIDAAGAGREVVGKIERFQLLPRIERTVLGRHRAAGKTLPWQTLFASAGFKPLQFSSTTESQAHCLLQRVPVRGFHVEKRQGSLFLYWQRRELVSVSAWTCSSSNL